MATRQNRMSLNEHPSQWEFGMKDPKLLGLFPVGFPLHHEDPQFRHDYLARRAVVITILAVCP